MQKTPTWTAVVAVHNDEAVLKSTLLRSPSLQSPQRLLIQKDYDSVAAAYNAALQKTDANVILFLHPDVYLPEAWEASFGRALADLAEKDPDWGVLGLYGTAHDGTGRGFLYSTGRQGFIGAPSPSPERVRTVDEFVFAVRRVSGLRCDEKLPSAQFQLGATDLCLEAESRGMKNYVAPCFALHNSNRWSRLPMSFWPCYLHIRSKWKKSLPIRLPYAVITRGCGPMLKESIRTLLGIGGRRHRILTRVDDPVAFYQSLRDGLSLFFELPKQP
jgi:Glycosyltransferase like family